MSEQKIEAGTQAPAVVPPPAAQEAPKPGVAAEAPKGGQPAAPEEFKLSIREGVEIDPKTVEGYKEAWKKGPQAVLDFYLDIQKEAVERFSKEHEAALKTRDADNEKALRSDPDFGKNYEANKVIAQRPLAKYADPATAKYLTERGLANDPVLTKFLHKIGAAMGEDTTVNPQPGPTEVNGEQDLSARFPNSPELFKR